LDEPFKLQPNTPLLVTVFAPDVERADWSALATQSLARAYGPDEPDYSEAAVLAALDDFTRRGRMRALAAKLGRSETFMTAAELEALRTARKHTRSGVPPKCYSRS
jgi:hypothetical protein